MSGLPKMTVVGTLTGEPDLKMLPSGVAVVSLNIACNDRKYNRETKSFEDGSTTYVRATLWREYAEHVAESLHKGDKVIAIGQLKQRDWEKDGQKRTSFELDIEEIGPTLRFVTAPTSRAAKSAPVTAGWGNPSDEPAW